MSAAKLKEEMQLPVKDPQAYRDNMVAPQIICLMFCLKKIKQVKQALDKNNK